MPDLDPADICIFLNSPPGQHGMQELGGDEQEDPETRQAGASAAGGSAAAALAAGAVGALAGPVVAIAAAAVGAYSGSLVGAAAGMGAEPGNGPADERRPGGVMLAVRIALPGHEDRVIAALRAEGALDIESAEGEWRDGDWIDFDPLAAPRLIAPAPDDR
ncbi:MAG: hypothetical protein IPL06_21055 [Betaproteobacteria bacterium]|nr:hypothetical protein [Betaproteobacteria bacterium]